jgi:hypothetical protein
LERMGIPYVIVENNGTIEECVEKALRAIKE